jgi:hypothetical protein
MKMSRRFMPGLVLLAGFTGVSGCGSSPKEEKPALDVTPITGRDVVALSADDIVRVMRRAGFTDVEIVTVGPYVRNALATAGGARLKLDNTVDAMFAVDGNNLHISSRRAGSFVYPLTSPTTQPN